MTNKKSLMLGVIVILSLVLITGLVSAAETLRSPLTGTFHSGTVNLTCETALGTITNVTFMYGIAGSANTTVYVENTTGDQTIFSIATHDISSKTDSASYIAVCIATNTTEDEYYSASVASITFDSTNPNVEVTRHGLYYVEQQAYSQVECVYSDGVDTDLTITRTLTKPNGDTVTTTEDLHTFADGDFEQLGDYTYDCTATDDSANTNSETTTFNVVTVESAGSSRKTAMRVSRVLSGDDNSVLIGAGIVIVILVIIVGGGLSTVKNKSKKRRKR